MRPQVQLQAEGPPLAKIQSWERQLTRSQSPCGCDQGAGGLLVGAIGCLLYLLLRPGGWGHPGSHELWIACGVIVATTSIGKGIGILMARRKLRVLIREIQAEWKPQPPPERNFGDVGPVRLQPPRRCCRG